MKMKLFLGALLLSLTYWGETCAFWPVAEAEGQAALRGAASGGGADEWRPPPRDGAAAAEEQAPSIPAVEGDDVDDWVNVPQDVLRDDRDSPILVEPQPPFPADPIRQVDEVDPKQAAATPEFAQSKEVMDREMERERTQATKLREEEEAREQAGGMNIIAQLESAGIPVPKGADPRIMYQEVREGGEVSLFQGRKKENQGCEICDSRGTHVHNYNTTTVSPSPCHQTLQVESEEHGKAGRG